MEKRVTCRVGKRHREPLRTCYPGRLSGKERACLRRHHRGFPFRRTPQAPWRGAGCMAEGRWLHAEKAWAQSTDRIQTRCSRRCSARP